MLVSDNNTLRSTILLNFVSILVLMDVGLRRHINHASWIFNSVSILVLMDVGLRPYSQGSYLVLNGRFNPCFNGCWSPTVSYATGGQEYQSFNPCFNGCWSPTYLMLKH